MIELTFSAPSNEAANQIGLLIIGAVQEQLSGPRHGRWYPMPGNAAYDKLTPKEARAENYGVKFTGASSRGQIVGAAYQASAPGESPASRTGRLRQSFHMVISMIMENFYEVRIRSNVIYADDMEYGSERVDARPYLKPAVEKVLSQIRDIQTQFMYKIMRGYV